MKLDLLILAIAPVVTIILWIYLKDKYDVALFNATRGLADCIEDIYKTKYLDK